MTMLWLCLRFPLLPLDVFSRTPAQQQRAIAVVQKSVVLCHNDSARQYGVAAGISASTAQALCADLLLIERQPAREAAALHNLADWAYRFTPTLMLQPPHSLLLEIGASLTLFGGLTQLLLQVEAQLAEREHMHQAAVAPTPAGAHLLSRALSCTAASIPEACRINDNDAFRDTIARLPLDLLDCAEQQQRRMRQMGFSCIGDLLSLPRAALGKRFGQAFLEALLKLTGEQTDLRPIYRPRQFFHTAQHFLEPVHDTTMLLFPMRRMLRELDQFLTRRQSYCQRLSWCLRDQGKQSRVLQIPCSLQHNNHAALFDLTRLKLQDLHLGEAAESIALSCRHHAPVLQHNAALFGNGNECDGEAERLLLDKLTIRLGKEHIHAIRSMDAHLPEQAWQAVSGDAPASKPGNAMPVGTERPFWVLQEPQPLRKQRNRLLWSGRIRILRGPERIDSAWWAGHGARDYFIARHDSGALCWVFREQASQQWFLHGLFG